MGLLGMAVVDGIVSGVTTAGNALLSPFTEASRLARTGLEHFKTKHKQDPNAAVQAPTPPKGASLPDPEVASDPAVPIVKTILGLARGLQELIQGGEGGKPQWATIRTRDAVSYKPCSIGIVFADLRPPTEKQEWGDLH